MMFGNRIAGTVGMVGVILMVAGCSTNTKRRITMLEEVNRNLTGELNKSHNALDAARRDRDNLKTRLADAEREAEYLRTQLAAVPEPEPVAPGWTAVPGGAMISIEGSVLFSPGRAVLRKDSRKTLDAIVSTVQGEYADKDILVFGHTDNQPIRKSGWTDNWQLSTERSLAVVRHLTESGVAPARLVACGCGEHRPRASNATAADQAKNRRVEIFAIDPRERSGR